MGDEAGGPRREAGGPGLGRRARVVPLLLLGAVLVAMAVIVGGSGLAAAGERIVGTVATAAPGWALVAVTAEAGSLLAFGTMHHRLLCAGGVRVRWRPVVGMTLAANALHLTMPGGAALSAAYGFRRRREFGAGPAVATWSMVAAGLASSAALVAVGAGGAAFLGVHTSSVGDLALEAAAVVALGVAVSLLVRFPAVPTAVVTAALRGVNRLRGRPVEQDEARIARQTASVHHVHLPPRTALAVGLLALVNWLLDLTCLAACATAVGATGMTPAVLLLAYASGMAVGGATLVPGGLGVVDSALVAGLLAGGTSVGTAVGSVVLFRLIALVGVASVGWLAWWFDHRPSPVAGTCDGPAVRTGRPDARR